MVGGDGGGAQLVDVAAVVHVDGLGLIGVKSNNGLQKGNIDIDHQTTHFYNSTSNIGKLSLCHRAEEYSSILVNRRLDEEMQ